MIITFTNEISKKPLNIDFKELIGSWCESLSGLLISNYMENLIYFIDEKYKTKDLIFPLEQTDIFRAFKLCPFEDLKVVIINSQPYLSVASNGLAFGCDDPIQTKPPLLKAMLNCVDTTIYGQTQADLDYTLVSWAEQGVLLLNTSLTAQHNENHSIYWKNFIRRVIEEINKKKKNIIFVFMDENNDYFKQYIGLTKHTIIQNKDRFFHDSLNPLFQNIDKEIDKIYDKENDKIIVW